MSSTVVTYCFNAAAVLPVSRVSPGIDCISYCERGCVDSWGGTSVTGTYVTTCVIRWLAVTPSGVDVHVPRPFVPLFCSHKQKSVAVTSDLQRVLTKQFQCILNISPPQNTLWTVSNFQQRICDHLTSI